MRSLGIVPQPSAGSPGPMPEPGLYRATLVEIKDQEGSAFGPQWALIWRIDAALDGGDFPDDAHITQWVNQTLHPSGHAYATFCALIGRDIKSGEEITADDLIGTAAQIEVGQGRKQDGSLRVKKDGSPRYDVLTVRPLRRRTAEQPQPEPPLGTVPGDEKFNF